MRFAAMANIFLLEDDKILSKGISIALKKDEHMVTAVYGYLEALKQYQKQKYDLFLLDINLPDGNGLEFCEKIRETSETPVLFLTANDTEEDMLEGFGVGCDDYISKPFSIEVLRKKVLAVLKRSGVGKFRMKYRDLELDKEKCLVLMKGQEIHLTSTEYKLLLYLMENRGRVVTKAMLLEQLWDIDGNFVDDNTVRVNITVIVAPITSRIHTKAKLPTHTLINDFEGLDKNSIILFEQIRTIDKQRLRKYVGMLSTVIMARADKALAISISLREVNNE